MILKKHLIFKTEIFANYRDCWYIVLFTRNGYRRCFIGINKDLCPNTEKLLSIKCHGCLSEGRTSINKHAPYLVLPEKCVWVSFSCCVLETDKPSYKTLVKYYPSMRYTDDCVGLKEFEQSIDLEDEQSGQKHVHRSLDFCINECERIIDNIYKLKRM